MALFAVPKDYSQELAELDQPQQVKDYTHELEQVRDYTHELNQPKDYGSELDSIAPKKKKPSIWGRLPPGSPSFSEAMAAQPELEKMIAGGESPRLLIEMLPEVNPQIVQDALDVFSNSPRKEPGTTAKVVSGAEKAMLGTAAGLTSYENLPFLAMPFKGLVGRLVSLGFGADMLRHIPEQVEQLKKTTQEKDVAGQVESTIGLLLNGTFAGLAIKHGLTRETPGVRALAENIVSGKEDPFSSRIKSEIDKIKGAGAASASPEAKAFFGGIDPEVAGTTPAKVQAFARSMGMEWKPQPKEPIAPVQPTEPAPVRAEPRLTRATEPAPEPAPIVEPAPAWQPAIPGLVPVLQTSTGSIYPGMAHADGLNAASAMLRGGLISPEEFSAVMDAQANDDQHRFLNTETGEVLSRNQAGKAVGIGRNLDSRDLPDAYKIQYIAKAEQIAQDLLNKTNAKQPPQAPANTVQAPVPVAAPEQAKSVEAPAPGVPVKPIEATPPAPAQPQDRSVEVKGVPVPVHYDPDSRSKQKPGMVEARVYVGLKGELVIAVPEGSILRPVWTGPVRELEQSGAIKIAGGTVQILNEEQLFRSPFLKKSLNRNLKAYKLPGERLERQEGVAAESVIAEAARANPFFGEVLALLTPDISKLRGIASARTGGAKYASNDAKSLSAQVLRFTKTVIRDIMEKAMVNVDSLSLDEKQELLKLGKARKYLEESGPHTPEDVQAVANALVTAREYQDEERTKGEVPLDTIMPAASRNPETGEVGDVGDIGAEWDPARTSTIIGQIEDKNPKLYQSFEADPNNDKAWEVIEQELVGFLNGDKVGAEVLAEAIRQKRMEGWMAGRPVEGSEFEEHQWLTGISAQGKDGIVTLLNNRNIQLDPEIRRIGLALLQRIPAKYLEQLTFSIDATGTAGGEFIPWLKTAKIAMDATNPTIAAHELSHYLANFLTDKDRSAVSAIRRSEIDSIRESDPEFDDFAQYIDRKGGSSTSTEYQTEYIAHSPSDFKFQKYYKLVNDDEYFAHYMSEAGAKPAPELKTLMDKVRDIIKRILTAIKAWLGNRDAYFDQLIRKFEKGEFDVNSQGGMLFERNNQNKPKSLQPIKSLPELRKFTKVDQGPDEAVLVRTLTHEQNQPLVGQAAGPFRALPRGVRAYLPGVASRLAALTEVQRQGEVGPATPLKHYAVLVNALSLQQEAKTLGIDIQKTLDDIKLQNQRGGKASAAEARASQLEDMAQSAISSYKDFLLSEKKRATNDGVAQGLNEAIKSLDSLRDSTESLKRAIEFIGEGVSMEELNNPGLTTQQVVDAFKARIMKETGSATWQQAVIPPGKNRPGVSNEQLRIAVRVLQENQQLVQDLITHKELSDPNFASIMKTGEPEIDKQIASLTYRELRSFLKSYRSITGAKDKARQIYIKHRLRLKNLIEKLEEQTEAETFLHDQVLNAPSFRGALAESASHGFMSADLVRDHSGSDVLKRTYYNPANREEAIDIVDGTTKEDYERNIEAYEKVQEWFEEALDNESIDPLDRNLINLELARIREQEYNPAFSPTMSKRAAGRFNLPDVLSNLVGNSLNYAMQKIGGRAAVQASAVFQARSEARRRVAEIRHTMQYPMQQLILDASRGHTIPLQQWIKEVAEPVLASFNSIGSKQIKATDTTRYGRTVTGKDMEAIRGMKLFSDAMTKASSDMELHTARQHPIRIKEVLSGREILRPQQGGTELIMPRRFSQSLIQALTGWTRVKGNQKVNEVVAQLSDYVQSGTAFEDMVLAHIYSINRYPDYVGTTRFKDGYREIYRRMLHGQTPSSFNEVVDIVFAEQTGQDVATQLGKEDIAKEIITKEMDPMVLRILDQRSKDRAADTPGQSVRIESADNFMTRPRGQMVAPDGGYQYSVVSDTDIRWMVSSVLEAHEQLAVDGLTKIQKMLRDYVKEWEDRAKHPDAQAESDKLQLSGEDWMNYRESKQMLNQLNRHLERSSPEAFKSFIDEQFGGLARRGWSILIQSLLQSATVLKNNLFGMNLRLWQMEQQWRGDGLFLGMPKWLVKLPVMAKNTIAWPMRDLPAFVANETAYKKAIKKGVKVNGLVGEEALRAIADNPALAASAAQQVGGYTLKRAVLMQRLRDLGAAGPYGIQDQIMRYIKMGTYGGSLENLDPTSAEKFKGVATSVLGLFQETGFGVMMPKAFAPRKLEQFLNFQAIRHADRLIEELSVNLKEAVKDREGTGRMEDPVTDLELLGDSSAKKGDALYMRKIFDRAGLNLDALIERLKLDRNRDLLTPAEWNSFVLEVAKELNMPSSDNRIQFKSGFGRVMSSLMGYGFWYNERLAEALAKDSHRKFDPAALYRGLFFVGVIAAMGIFIGTPLQRLLKKLLYEEEDLTGRFSEDNTGWRNAGVLWEQTAPFWPIIGSVMSQLYDARSGGSKLFNFLPVTMATQLLQTGNEVGQTGNVFYPAMKLIRSWFPNTKIVVNRMPEMEGIVDVNNAARLLRSTAAGDIEVRSQKGGGAIRYSPVSTQMQMAVNEMARENPDYSMINQYRASAVQALVKRGASKKDAERRFDLGVLARFPQNTVFGRPLTTEEKVRVIGRMTPDRAAAYAHVESAFDSYASRYGLRPPSSPRQARKVRGLGKSYRLIRARGRTRRRSLSRNRSLTRRRSKRLVRG